MEVWRLLGLTRGQLVLVGAGSGAVSGGLAALFLGHPHAAPLTMPIGAAGGAAVAWFGAEKAINVKLPRRKIGPVAFGGGKIGGRQAEASILPQSNLFWVVLDRYFLYVELCASWAHGRREKSAPIGDEEKKMGVTTRWEGAGRKKVTEYVANILKRKDPEKLDAAERALRAFLLAELHGITGF